MHNKVYGLWTGVICIYNKVYGQVAKNVLKTFVKYVNMEQTQDIY